MIIGASEDISVSKTGPIGSSARVLSLDEWLGLQQNGLSLCSGSERCPSSPLSGHDYT